METCYLCGQSVKDGKHTILWIDKAEAIICEDCLKANKITKLLIIKVREKRKK